MDKPLRQRLIDRGVPAWMLALHPKETPHVAAE